MLGAAVLPATAPAKFIAPVGLLASGEGDSTWKDWMRAEGKRRKLLFCSTGFEEPLVTWEATLSATKRVVGSAVNKVPSSTTLFGRVTRTLKTGSECAVQTESSKTNPLWTYRPPTAFSRVANWSVRTLLVVLGVATFPAVESRLGSAMTAPCALPVSSCLVVKEVSGSLSLCATITPKVERRFSAL